MLKVPSIMIRNIIVLLLTSLLFGCLTTPEKESVTQRATLAELAQQPVDLPIEKLELSQRQRAQKLAELYQSILTLEPDGEVRTQIAYRLVQIKSESFDDDLYKDNDENEQLMAEKFVQREQKLQQLIVDYKRLLDLYPQRAENESIRYHLAKALALQGNISESLQQMELLLAQFPQTSYAAELYFRSAEIYYNQQDYLNALAAYQAVIKAPNNQTYLVNSLYMQAWSLFKLNRLAQADRHFIQLLDFILSEEKVQLYEDEFSFAHINKHYQNIANDVQRILSISLSQQAQAKSLLALVKSQKSLPYLYLYQHILFKNLADFLVKNDLKYDAELTYQAYINYQPNNLWAARFSLNLLALYQQQGKNKAAQQLRQKYVQQYGLATPFWQQAIQLKSRQKALTKALYDEVLPNIIDFSYQQSRYLYANAQQLPSGKKRVTAFANAAQWLATYLQHAKLPQAQAMIKKLAQSQGLLADKFLYADALFEAQQYEKALAMYEIIAYQKNISEEILASKLVNAPRVLNSTKPTSGSVLSAYRDSGKEKQVTLTKNNAAIEGKKESELNKNLRKEAAYAATLTVRKILTNLPNSQSNKGLLLVKSYLDHAFVENFPNDERALVIASKAAQYSFDAKAYAQVDFYTAFVLERYGVNDVLLAQPKTLAKAIKLLDEKAKKQLQVVTQLRANSFYQQQQYAQAEQGYQLALQFISKNNKQYKALRELIAASIYLQAQALKVEQPLLAVQHYLRLGKIIPEASYRINAEFDAANLLLAQQQWQQAITTLLNFQQQYPQHEYSASIPAKLVQAYEKLGLWQRAAEQLLAIYHKETETELKREALYSAADYFLKAKNLTKAITTFRTYAHTYPEPFAIAQEVRFKMSEFYRQTKENNKRYFWYRQLIKYHEQQAKQATITVQQRSTYLAAYAALELGIAHQTTFNSIKLKIPLRKSLQRKQKAMKRAINYYQAVLNSALAEFVPQATYHLAQMYRQLAIDVMKSQRPKGLDELALEEYELLLEEIAYPFEEKAIEIHQTNIQRAWQDIYDQWIAKSFAALAQLEPAQYNKQEQAIHAIEWLH